MEEIDIFKTGAQLGGSWASFKVPGDSVQGTYVGARKAVDGYNNEQIVYELFDRKTNSIINVGFRTSKKPLHDKMARVKFGQIIGFRYVEDRKITNRATGTASNTKIIEPWADPKVVDQEWSGENPDIAGKTIGQIASSRSSIQDQSAADSMFSDDSDSPYEPSMDEVNKAFNAIGAVDSANESEEELLKKINALAAEKLGITDPALVATAVMEKTLLPFLKANYAEIIKRLTLA